jgi:hypothetical protein
MNWRWAQYFLAIAAAVAPLLGVFFWGWSAREVVMIYWFENLIIGFWQLMKMLAAGGWKVKLGGVFVLPGVLFTMVFFAIHYGGFCAGHGMFVMQLTGDQADFEMGNLNFALGPLLFLQMAYHVVTQVWQSLPEATLWSVASLFAMRGLGFFQDFIMSGKWKEAEVQKLMFEPYKNIITLHVAIVFGAGLVMTFEGAWPLLAIIVLGKLVMDFVTLRKQEVELAN